MRTGFIRPALPVLRPAPPTGEGWIHELKFDGWRVQLAKREGAVVLYSRSGYDVAGKFPTIARAGLSLPDGLHIDGEMIAYGPDGLPSFEAIGKRGALHCMWCFDLLRLDGLDLTKETLRDRRRLLEPIVAGHSPELRFSEGFPDGAKLLAAAEGMGLEGIVSKSLIRPYRSGSRCGWIKVKTAAWRMAQHQRIRAIRRRHQSDRRPTT